MAAPSTMTDADLRAHLERRQRAQGIEPGRPVEPVAVACCECGEPVPCPLPPTAGRRLVIEWNRRTVEAASSIRCDTCRRRAYEERRAASLERAAQQCRERAAALVADMPGTLAKRGVPPMWVGASFDTCSDLPAELVEQARRWAREPRGFLYLCGPVGCGKTTLGVAVMHDVIANCRLRPWAVRFIGEGGYLDALKASFDKGDRTRSRRELEDNDPRRIKLLVFDDLASTRLSEWGVGVVAQLIEDRHADMLATIFTSNIDPGTIAQRIDPRVASRIVEVGQLVMFPARDFRLEGAKA